MKLTAHEIERLREEKRAAVEKAQRHPGGPEGARRKALVESALQILTHTQLGKRLGRNASAVSAVLTHNTWVSDEWLPILHDILGIEDTP